MTCSVFRVAAIAACLATGTAHAFSVGNDAACTHTSIQAAIDAARALGGTAIHTITVANNASYTGQALLIADANLSIEGGYSSCSAAAPTDMPTVLSGAGNGGWPVLNVVNASSGPALVVKLRNLEVTLGTHIIGGGLQVVGHADVELAGVRLHHNQATHGAGIFVQGQDATHPALLRVGASGNRISSIDHNHASGAGGGVIVESNAQALFERHAVSIMDNQAVQGGGLYVTANGQALLNVDTGADLPPAQGLERNQAVTGGGAYVADGGMLSVDPEYTITGNQATSDGGGITAHGAAAQVFLFATTILGNRADSDGNGEGCGGGLHAESDASITMFGDLPAPLCSPASPCSHLDDNQAAQGGGVCARFGGKALLIGTWVKGNVAPEGAAVYGSVAQRLELDSVLMTNAHDEGHNAAIHLDFNSHFFANGLTLTDSAGGTSLIRLQNNSTASFLYSILYQPGTSVLIKDFDSTVTAACVLAHEVFPMTGEVRVGDPMFVNPGEGDYALRHTSPAVDACADIVERETDANAQPRGIDLPTIPNLGGAYDLGAFELQRTPEIFANGFE
ncbi:MAG: hypothetical protein R3F10_01145 [Lysobacteraceae bacterium]